MGNAVRLRRGELLVFADKTMTVHTGDSTVSIAAGTMALVSKDNLVTKVRNIWEPKQFSVKQFIGKNHVALSAGQESIIGKDQKIIQATYRHDSVGRRQVRHLEMDTHRVSTSEYSIITLMASSPVISALALSKESEDVRMTGKMLKMAAALQMSTGGHGTYTGTWNER